VSARWFTESVHVWPPRRRRHRQLRTRCSWYTVNRLRFLSTRRISRAICLHGRPPPSPATETCYDLHHRRRNWGSPLFGDGAQYSWFSPPRQKSFSGTFYGAPTANAFLAYLQPRKRTCWHYTNNISAQKFQTPPPKKKRKWPKPYFFDGTFAPSFVWCRYPWRAMHVPPSGSWGKLLVTQGAAFWSWQHFEIREVN